MENGPNFVAERVAKTIQFIETSLKKGHRQQGAKSKLCDEYESFLLEEISLDKNEEDFIMKTKEISEENEEMQTGKDILLSLQADIELNENILQSNQDEIRKITFQDFADRQSYKTQFEDRKHEIQLYFSETVGKMSVELENAVKEHKLFEEKLKGQVAVEIGKKNIGLKEVKMTFQKNIAEKHGVLLSLLKDVNELRKTLDDLKAKKNDKVSQYNNSRRQNVLWFQPAIPSSTSTPTASRPNQPVQQIFEKKLPDENNLNTLYKSSPVDLTTNSPTSGKSLTAANVPLSHGVINSSQKPIAISKSDSNIQDDPWAFNETVQSQMPSTSMNVRKLPKVYAKSGARRFQFQSK